MTIVVQWLHVLLGIFWFGSNLYVDAILIPTLNTLPLQEHQKIGALVGPRTSRVLVPAGLAAVVLGFLRGTIFGRLQSLDAVFGTAYGITWLIALLLSAGVILWGLLVLKPRAEALGAAKSPEAYGAIVSELKVLTLVEIAGRDRRLRRNRHLHDSDALWPLAWPIQRYLREGVPSLAASRGRDAGSGGAL